MDIWVLNQFPDLHLLKNPTSIIMAGESRYNYKHGISPGWVEDTRVSVTFRTINK
jgi:hypothetical protein